MSSESPRSKEWAEEYKRAASESRDLSVPTETLVRLFRGTYVPNMPQSFAGMRALDVSCGNGNNTFFLCSLGLDTYGTEIHEDMCVDVRQRAKDFGYQLKMDVGTNHKLPYEDNFFDFLVSWNVLHYEKTEQDIRKGIAEYARVLKPGGRLFISTTGPTHKILEGSSTVGSHLYQIGRTDDFRQGETFFYFDAPNYLHYYFDPKFDDVMIGRIQDHLFTETLDWWLVTGCKK